MSGTSADGVDVAIVELGREAGGLPYQLLAFRCWPYEAEVRRRILAIAQGGRASLGEVARLNTRVGELFAEAALRTLREEGIAPSEIDFIGSHGQTIGHFPRRRRCLGRPVRATLQVGDPAVIAKQTGIVTVGDFRVADIAVGGTGAPLVPLVDWLLFRSGSHCVATLNIGGISNITVIPPGGDLSEVIGFDTGPGNALLDSLTELYWGEPMDRDGRHASSGRVDEGWLKELLAHPYLHALPPKSTGREVFGRLFATKLAREGERRRLRPADVMATATAFVAASIAHALRTLVDPSLYPKVLICSGGGTHNPVLMSYLRQMLPNLELRFAHDAGVDPDAKEAVAFALLADRTLRGEVGNCPKATGAHAATVLGKICLP